MKTNENVHRLLQDFEIVNPELGKECRQEILEVSRKNNMGLTKIREWAVSTRRNIHALYFASRDPRVPKSAKIQIGLVIAYALSPIDLIPDFIPILGQLDDLILLPLGIWLAIYLIPKDIWQECLSLADGKTVNLSQNHRGTVIIITLWICGLIGLSMWLWSLKKS